MIRSEMAKMQSPQAKKAALLLLVLYEGYGLKAAKVEKDTQVTCCRLDVESVLAQATYSGQTYTIDGSFFDNQNLTVGTNCTLSGGGTCSQASAITALSMATTASISCASNTWHSLKLKQDSWAGCNVNVIDPIWPDPCN